MRCRSWLIALCCFLLASSAPSAPVRPALVLLIAVDQFRYDYLPRFRESYEGGLKRLLNDGAVFVNANLEHYPSVTAPGHSTMLSGATPKTSGIIGNDWYDRASHRQVTSVSDDSVQLLGGKGGIGSSPHRLLVSTLGDEIKRSASKQSKVIGLSMKDRASILPAGRFADAAYWYDESTGEFVSSTYYFPALPEWARKFNLEKQNDRFAGQVWQHSGENATERRLPTETGPKLNAAVYSSSFGNELLELFAERAIEAEQLGRRGPTDELTVSFSSNDAVGHTFGPDSPESRTISIEVDQAIGRLLDFVDKQVGLSRVLIIMTSDHGVGPTPEILTEQHMAGGRITGDFFAPIQKALEQRFGPGKWVEATAGTSPYLNYELIAEKKADPREVRQAAADAIAAAPHVARVYTRDQLLSGRAPADIFDSRVIRGFNPSRSGDLEILLDPYWIRGGTGATHGTPYNYDTHIPLIFMGPGIRPGRYYQRAAANDIAPTLAALLDVETPSGSVGRILTEILEDAGGR